MLDTKEPFQSAFDTALENGRQLPIDKHWSEIESVVAIQLEQMLRGDQDHAQTASNIDLEIRKIVPSVQPFPPIPIFNRIAKTESSESQLNLIDTILGLTAIGTLTATYSRRTNRKRIEN